MHNSQLLDGGCRGKAGVVQALIRRCAGEDPRKINSQFTMHNSQLLDGGCRGKAGVVQALIPLMC